MKKYLIIALLISTPSFADGASVRSIISATIVQAVSLSQDPSTGDVTVTGEQPLYCTEDASGVMCYY